LKSQRKKNEMSHVNVVDMSERLPVQQPKVTLKIRKIQKLGELIIPNCHTWIPVISRKRQSLEVRFYRLLFHRTVVAAIAYLDALPVSRNLRKR
jgi:hypothetical protein